jgi:APA family basic amino acid/polyamine antiporter
MALVGLWFAAMGGAFWSYDGWGNVAYVGGEIKNANKNLPRAIILGVGIVMTVYLLVNLAYMYVLPLRDVMHAPENRVASLMMSTVAGKGGAVFIALLIVLSTFDTVNSTILTNGRVYYAMAMEKLFWKRASYVHPQYHTPSVSLWLQGGWAVVLLISGSFDLITSMYVFVNWLFYFLIPVALFILRFRDKRSQANATTFRVPLYPILPIFFALFTAAYVVQTFLLDIKAFSIGASPTIQSLMGLLLVAAGLPFYLRLRARRR